MKTVLIALLLGLFCSGICAKPVYIYSESGNKIWLEESESVVYVKKDVNFTSAQSNMTAMMKHSIKKVDTLDIAYRIELEQPYKLPAGFSFSRELLYAPDSTVQWVSDRIFVRPKNPDRLGQLLASADIKYLSFSQFGSLPDEFVVTLDESDIIGCANRLYETGEVVYSIPCFYRKVHFSNQYYEEQWSLNNPVYPQHDINAEAAWKMSSGEGVTIAVLDAGVDLDHPDLKDNMLAGYDATGNGGNGDDIYGYGHGTRCAGILAACDNSIGIKGIAYKAKIYPIRMGGAVLDDQQLTRAIINATSNADVFNCSINTGSPSAMVTNAINTALSNGRNGKGCVIVFSTGNDEAKQLSYPAGCSKYILNVGASNALGHRWTKSNYGDEIDLVAPGDGIFTTDVGGGYYPEFGATSAAAPHVAGVAALMLSVNPELTAKEVHDMICSTAYKLSSYKFSNNSSHPDGTWNKEVGHGLVDAEAAVNKALDELFISGADLICDKATYAISALPAGSSIEWSASRPPQLWQPGMSTTPPLFMNNINGGTTMTFSRTSPFVVVLPWQPQQAAASQSSAGKYTGIAYINAKITLPGGATKTISKQVTVGTLKKPELLLNGFKYLYNEPMAPGKIGQTYTFSCENVDKGKLLWEVQAPGADPYTKTNVSSVSITPVTSGAIKVTVTNTDGCPEDNHASGMVVISPSIVIDPINPVNPGGTIVASVWCEGAGDESGEAAVMAAAADGAGVEAEKMPYEGGYTVELWDDHSMLGRWQREGHVMEIPGTGTLSGRIYYLRLYVDGELADVAKVMVY